MSENLINTLEIGHIIEIDYSEDHSVSKTMKAEILEVSSDNKCIISIPFYKGRFYPLHMGKRYSFFYNKRDTGVYQFQGLVMSRIDHGKHHAFSILRVSEFNKSQRRLYYRLNILIEGVLLIEDGTFIDKVLVEGKVKEVEFVKYKEVRCIIKDISGGGVKLQTNSPYPLDSKAIIMFSIQGETYKIESVVKRCLKSDDILVRYDVGLSFGVMDETERSRIIAYIFDKQRNLLKKGLV